MALLSLFDTYHVLYCHTDEAVMSRASLSYTGRRSLPYVNATDDTLIPSYCGLTAESLLTSARKKRVCMSFTDPDACHARPRSSIMSRLETPNTPHTRIPVPSFQLALLEARRVVFAEDDSFDQSVASPARSDVYSAERSGHLEASPATDAQIDSSPCITNDRDISDDDGGSSLDGQSGAQDPVNESGFLPSDPECDFDLNGDEFDIEFDADDVNDILEHADSSPMSQQLRSPAQLGALEQSPLSARSAHSASANQL